MVLEELEDEIRRNTAFARSQDVLAKLAAEAIVEYHTGKTQGDRGLINESQTCYS